MAAAVVVAAVGLDLGLGLGTEGGCPCSDGGHGSRQRRDHRHAIQRPRETSYAVRLDEDGDGTLPGVVRGQPDPHNALSR